jgi:ABC-type uncharacterized transport system YnjBCD ATPase subunit
VSITFEAVTKRFADGTVAVDALDLQVPAAQTVVLVGPSGCGKTTTLRMIKRLVEPTAGRILLDGQDVTTASPARLRRGIGYVIQQARLFPHRTVEDNLATVPLLNGWRRARARELMDLLGLDRAMACRYPYQLSGGQQQRVATLDAVRDAATGGFSRNRSTTRTSNRTPVRWLILPGLVGFGATHGVEVTVIRCAAASPRSRRTLRTWPRSRTTPLPGTSSRSSPR